MVQSISKTTVSQPYQEPVDCGCSCLFPTVKTVAAAVQSPFSEIAKDYNAGVRAHLEQDSQDHRTNTQKLILSQTAHLNPKSSIVMVIGAQPGIEPLKELLAQCKELWLLDFDQDTLDLNFKALGSSKKVKTKLIDLSAVSEELAAFKTKQEVLPCKTEEDFILQAKALIKQCHAKIESRKLGFGLLPDGQHADYVISSLVSSQLSILLRDELRLIAKKIFGKKLNSFFAREISDCCDAMIKKHAEDLRHWAGKKGAIYFADTPVSLADRFYINIRENTFVSAVKTLTASHHALFEQGPTMWDWDEFTVAAIAVPPL
jgi:hypothetical protein